MASPSFPYSCPPASSTQPAAMASSGHQSSGLISPPGSRRTSGDDPAPVSSAVSRQSLPSISEALGPEPLSRYLPSGLGTLPASSKVGDASTPMHTSAASDIGRYNQIPLSVPQSMDRPLSIPHPLPPTSHHGQTAQSVAFASHHQPRLPALQPSSGAQSPVSQLRTSLPFPPPPPLYDAPAASAAPATTMYQFGHSPATSQYRTSASNSNPAPVYPSPTQSLPPQYARSWKSNGVDEADARVSGGKIVGPAYGEVVKRQLDIFDLEGSLNEIAECSGKLLEFSRLYGDKAHHTHRTGPVIDSVPTLGEVEDLIMKSTKIQNALNRIKDVVIAQNASFKDQRQLAPNGHGYETSSMQQDEAKQGGFAGVDSKKRRGRAAPPGRCHSCNRAETPEWRRGPDGARTLCNACGLHYAKLTRKMGGGKAAIANSNLRPRALGSPNPT